jgi:hypothetical protein
LLMRCTYVYRPGNILFFKVDSKGVARYLKLH